MFPSGFERSLFLLNGTNYLDNYLESKLIEDKKNSF